MAFPQLSGQTTRRFASSTGPAVFMTVIALAAILAVAVWRLATGNPSSVQTPAVIPMVAAQPAASTAQSASAAQTTDQELHLAHAEQELVAAAEQLNTARRLLSTLSHDRCRNYLQLERRRAQTAWTACDTARRAIEQARNDIKVISSTGKE